MVSNTLRLWHRGFAEFRRRRVSRRRRPQHISCRLRRRSRCRQGAVSHGITPEPQNMRSTSRSLKRFMPQACRAPRCDLGRSFPTGDALSGQSFCACLPRSRAASRVGGKVELALRVTGVGSGVLQARARRGAARSDGARDCCRLEGLSACQSGAPAREGRQRSASWACLSACSGRRPRGQRETIPVWSLSPNDA